MIVNSIHILILFNLNIGEVLTDVLYQLLEGTVSLFPPFHTHNPFTSHHQQVFLIRIEIARAPLSFQFSAIPDGVVISSWIEQIEEVQLFSHSKKMLHYQCSLMIRILLGKQILPKNIHKKRPLLFFPKNRIVTYQQFEDYYSIVFAKCFISTICTLNGRKVMT